MENNRPDLDLDEQTLKRVANDALDAFKEDDESRQDWVEMHARWKRQFYQQDRPEKGPWEGSSSESMPLLTEACVQFHARAYKAMFPNRNIIRAIPAVAGAKEEIMARADRVGNHMSWQLMVQDRDYKRNMDRLLLGLPLHGSVVRKIYYNDLLGRNVVENVRAEDFVVPYGVGPRDIHSIERKSQIIYQSVNESKILAEGGIYIEPAVPMERGDENALREADDEASGIHPVGDHAFAKLIEQHTIIDLDGDGIAEPYILTVDATSRKLLRIAPRYLIDANGEPTDNKRAVEYFTHYNYIENPDGFYGLGQGHLIGPINTAVNKLLRQIIDAGTLANVGNMSGFVSDQAGIRGGEHVLELGKFKKVDSTADDMRRAIWQPSFPGPNAALGQVAQMLMGRSDRLATVTEALTGQTDKVIQPQALMALIDQSLEVFSTVYERVLHSWSGELQMLYDLNRMHLDREEYFAVNMADGTVDMEAITPDDYAGDLMVLPAADPKMTTKRQRLAQAEAEFNYAMQNPMVQQSPKHINAVYQRLFEAMDSKNIAEINPQAPEPPREDDPEKENMLALMPGGQLTPAYVDQDHEAHIQAHHELLLAQDNEEGPADPLAGYRETMTPEQVKALEEHVQQHVAYLYGVNEAEILNEGAMAQAPGDAALLEAAAGLMGPAGQGDLSELVGDIASVERTE